MLGFTTQTRQGLRLMVAVACLATWIDSAKSADWPTADQVASSQSQATSHANPVPPSPDDTAVSQEDPFLKQLYETNLMPIDLFSALRLAGEQNPQIFIAQQRVVEACALRQLAAAQILPTLNLGTSFDQHTGVLQQSSGNILDVTRRLMFLGSGAYAVAAGTVNIPGVMWNLNVSDTYYNILISRRAVERSEVATRTVQQDVLLSVALAYVDLVRAEGLRSVALQSRNDAHELARLTAAYLKSGLGRKADADRAATELARRESLAIRATGTVVQASAQLCKVLHLEPSVRLHAADTVVLPKSVVPEPIPLSELLAIAALNRPELQERRIAIAQAMLGLNQAHMLPFSPTLFVGFSAGTLGGGSNLVAHPVTDTPFGRGEPAFGAFSPRDDLDVFCYWTLKNLGVGNKALIDIARSHLQASDFEELATLDRVRSEVASAYARTHARFAQIRTTEMAITASTEAFQEDKTRVIGHEGIPLEAIDSLRLLARSRVDYLNAILDYNAAQFQLYVAIGKPPADVLARPIDENGEAQAPGPSQQVSPVPPAPPAN